MKQAPLILLADDNFDDQAFLRDAFDYIGAEVNLRIVDDGIEAVEYLKDNSNPIPDLIVLDYSMPELNGAQVLEQLQKEQHLQDVPKIILSTSGLQKHQENCLKLGASAYFIKPDNLFDLHKLAAELLKFTTTPATSD